jgi:DNA-binding MarR family transcriptional regulator
LGWDEGAFEFTPTDSVSAHTIGLKMDELLDRARSCAQKWADLKTIIPSNESILMVSRALKQEAGEISLSPSEWGTLLLVNGRRRVREIAAQTRLSEFETTKILGKLLSMGLLELKAVPTPPEAEVVTPEMLDELRKELTLLIGPMARMILERVAEEMGETLDDLPLYRLSEFLDALSIQIPKPQRERFEVKVNHWKRSWKLTKGGER